MKELFQVASSVSTPLALSGFFAAVVFFVFRQIVAKNIFPKLTSSLGAEVITLIVNRLFVLALAAMLLGFVGYVFTNLTPTPADTINNRVVHSQDAALALDAVHSTRQSISDICIFHMISLIPDPEQDGTKPIKLTATVNNQRISFPIHSLDFDHAPKPYSAKVEVPCSTEYSVAFGWTLRMNDGSEDGAGENDFHIVLPGQVVRYGVPWFDSMTYEIGYSARP